MRGRRVPAARAVWAQPQHHVPPVSDTVSRDDGQHHHLGGVPELDTVQALDADGVGIG